MGLTVSRKRPKYLAVRRKKIDKFEPLVVKKVNRKKYLWWKQWKGVNR